MRCREGVLRAGVLSRLLVCLLVRLIRLLIRLLIGLILLPRVVLPLLRLIALLRLLIGRLIRLILLPLITLPLLRTPLLAVVGWSVLLGHGEPPFPLIPLTRPCHVRPYAPH